jgi:hypothetical protein
MKVCFVSSMKILVQYRVGSPGKGRPLPLSSFRDTTGLAILSIVPSGPLQPFWLHNSTTISALWIYHIAGCIFMTSISFTCMCSIWRPSNLGT